MTTRSRHDPYLAFRAPGFGRYSLGSLLVHIGAAAQSVAIGWEIYQRTDSALALGLVGLVQALPMLLLTLPAGYLADIYDRRRLMTLGLAGTTLTSLALAAFSLTRGSIPAMFLLLFFDSAFHRLASPAGTALVPLLVPASSLESAIKWRSSMFHLASVIGPALGGIIVAFSVPAAYLFSAATTAVYVAVLWSLHIPEGKRSTPGRMLNQLREGLDFVWNQKIVLGAVSLDMVAVLLGGAVYLLPIFARDILLERPFGLRPEQALGWLRAAPALGAVIMALIMTHRPPIQRAGRGMLWAVAGFGLATIAFGLSRSFWLSFAMLFLTGFFDNISVVIRHTLVQARTPNELRGRVSAVNSMFIGSSNELGGFESGLVARFVGPVASVVSGGIGTLVVAASWAKLFPSLRRLGPLSEDQSSDEPTPS
ncbi:MAG: MFS transporter [Lentisphaerae bacterium]|nr:MFS transporter [Lentisphaerota bacterium]